MTFAVGVSMVVTFQFVEREQNPGRDQNASDDLILGVEDDRSKLKTDCDYDCAQKNRDDYA
jgi:hypothetical protein